MPPDEHELAEHRALRDAARAIFHADVAIVREGASPRKLAGKLGSRIEGASGRAGAIAQDHKGALTAGVAAIAGAGALWFLRGRLARAFTRLRCGEPGDTSHDPGEPDGPAPRSDGQD